MSTTVLDRCLEMALQKAAQEGRNNAGFWLAQQLWDNDAADYEGASIMRRYAELVPQPAGKEKYTEKEALSSWESAKKQPKREPWADTSSSSSLMISAKKLPYTNKKKASFDDIKPLTNEEIKAADPKTREAVRMLALNGSKDDYGRLIREEQERIEQDSSAPNLDIFDAPALHPSIDDLLPESLRYLRRFYGEAHQRDVFLTGALAVVAACQPNVWGRDSSGYKAPSVYLVVSSDPGQGKGVLSHASALGTSLVEYMEAVNLSRLEEYKQAVKLAKEGEAFGASSTPPDKPPTLRFFLPANSSATPFLRAMSENGGEGLVFATEIYSLTSARKNEWGDYTHTLLEAFEHESNSLMRSGLDITIKRPRLSVILSGTPDQVLTLIPCVENGLFSRFGFYYFSGTTKWKTHRPGRKFDEHQDALRRTSDSLLAMYRALKARDEPLYIDLSEESWDAVDETFAAIKERLEAWDLNRHLYSAVHRGATFALRFAISLAVLRHHEARRPLDDLVRSIEVTADDVNAALILSTTYLDHAIRFAQYLPQKQIIKSEYSRQMLFDLLTALPVEFSRTELNEAAEKIGMKKTAAYKYRKKMLQLGLVAPVEYGWCRKVESMNAEVSAQIARQESAESAETSENESENE